MSVTGWIVVAVVVAVLILPITGYLLSLMGCTCPRLFRKHVPTQKEIEDAEFHRKRYMDAHYPVDYSSDDR